MATSIGGVSLFTKIAQFFSGLWKNDIEPWLSDLGHEVTHDVVTQLVPYAAEAFAEIGTIAGGTGTLADKASAAGQALALTGQKALNAGVDATVHDIAMALASVSASITKGATAANQAVVTQVAGVPVPVAATADAPHAADQA